MDPYVQQLLLRADSEVQSKRNLIRMATSLRDVAQNRKANIPSVIASVARGLPAVRHLTLEADRKAEKLVDEQLKELEGLTGEQFDQRLRFFREREWTYLRGNFPSLVTRVDRTVTQLRLNRPVDN
jgi:hypothetical protein